MVKIETNILPMCNPNAQNLSKYSTIDFVMLHPTSSPKKIEAELYIIEILMR